MKKLLLGVTFVAMLGVPNVWAGTFGPVPVAATVDTIETLDCSILECLNADCTSNVPVPDMTFGSLVNSDPLDPSSALAAPNYFRVFCGINTSGRAYTVTQTGTQLTCTTGCAVAGAFIDDNAWVFTPGATVDTTDADDLADEPPPVGTIIGPKATANSTAQSWIDTGTNNNIVVIFADYAVAAPPNTVNNAAPVIPPNQASGSYGSTVTWTLTAK